MITTGVKGFVEVPFACTITAATLLSTDAAATSGSIVVDIWKDTYANYPPTVADTITASAKPTLSAASKSRDTTLTGWTTAIRGGRHPRVHGGQCLDGHAGVVDLDGVRMMRAIRVALSVTVEATYMALVRVQTTAKATGAGASLAVTSAVRRPSGTRPCSLIIGRLNGISYPLATCTDNYGNPYVRAAAISQTAGTDTAAAIYRCAAVAVTGAGFTITVTHAAGVNQTGCAIEISGVGAGLVLDQIKTAIGTSADPATGVTPALTADDEIVVAAYTTSGDQASITVESVSPAWTQEFEQLASTSAGVGEADSRLLTGALGTTTSCSATFGASGNWSAALATFKAGAALAVAERVETFLMLPV